jgi:cytosine/adenosine deaminase-related metal-dependent hydrolase
MGRGGRARDRDRARRAVDGGAPARLAGLSARKGTIAAGADADLIVFDPDAEWTVDPARLEHRHPVTPYAGMQVRGRVRTTILRGEIVYEAGRFDAPAGLVNLRGEPRREPSS